MNVTYPNAGAIVELDALPQAAGLDIPILLAVGDLRIVNALDNVLRLSSGIGDADRHLVLTRLEQGCDVELKGQISALMFSGLLSVHENQSPVIDGAEVQERHLVGSGRLGGEGAPVSRHSRVIAQVGKL